MTRLQNSQMFQNVHVLQALQMTVKTVNETKNNMFATRDSKTKSLEKDLVITFTVKYM